MDLLQFVKGLAGLGHAICERASTGRSLAIRQLPNDPARGPPATARITASTITLPVMDGCNGTATTCDAEPGLELCVTPPGPTAVCDWVKPPEDVGTFADSLGATLLMIAAPAKPSPTPGAAPMPPMPGAPPSPGVTTGGAPQPMA